MREGTRQPGVIAKKISPIRLRITTTYTMYTGHKFFCTQVQFYVERLLADFDLIMVTELMDESCVLLKRLMRWKLKDILYITKYSLTYAGTPTLHILLLLT